MKLLDKNNYKFTVKKSYYIDDKIIYLNATDHWTIIAKNNQQNPQNGNLWDKNCLLIDNESNEEYTYKLNDNYNVTSGNAGNIMVIINGEVRGKVGDYGDVIDSIIIDSNFNN